MKDFNRKVSLITGAASGIGRETALELARRGSDIVLADIDEPGIARVAREIVALGRKALCVAGDISKESDVSDLAARALEGMGQVDLLMNNAGVMFLGESQQMTLETWEWIVGINLWGPIRLTHALLPHMIERRSGHIVTTASIAGLVGTPGLAAYSATKFAMVGFSEALRVELKPHGIDVSVVCPGPVQTNLNDHSRFGSADASKANSGGIIGRTAYSGARAARQIVRGIERAKGHIVITPSAHVMWSLKRFSPELGYRVNRFLWGAFSKYMNSRPGR